STCSIAKLVDRLVVDSAAIIGALMVVPVVLVRTAKLKQVVAFQHGNIIANHLIVPIPDAIAGLLRVYVVRSKVLTGAVNLAAEKLQRSAQSGRLRRISRARVRPIITQETVVNVVRRIRGDVGSQPGDPDE